MKDENLLLDNPSLKISLFNLLLFLYASLRPNKEMIGKLTLK